MMWLMGEGAAVFEEGFFSGGGVKFGCKALNFGTFANNCESCSELILVLFKASNASQTCFSNLIPTSTESLPALKALKIAFCDNGMDFGSNGQAWASSSMRDS